jgi:hypothetical protein
LNYTHTRKVTLLKAPGIAGNFLIKGAISAEYDDFTAADDGQLFPIIVQDFASNYIVYANCLYTHATRTLTRGTLVETNSNTQLNLSKYANITVTGDDQSLGNADAVARGKIDSILKKAADTVPAGGQALILRDDGTSVLLENKGASAVTVPTPTNDASLLAAGLTAPVATGGKPGSVLGSAATLAALPKVAADGQAAAVGDYSVLTVQDGTNAPGLYRWNGTAFVFDTALSGSTQITELVTISAKNTLANLSQVPKSSIDWEINGAVVKDGITVSGQAVTYDAALVTYSIYPGLDTVQATYLY